MTTIEERYPELSQLHHEFMRALSEDPKPLSKSAYLWYQAIEFDRSPRKPSATARGHEVLLYLKKTEQLKRVPGQEFPKGKTPKDVCSNLISRHAADWDGPYQINFRYDRNTKGIWSGFYSIETSAQHRDIVAGRAPYDEAIADAIRKGWKPDMEERMLNYGSVGADPGPKMINVLKSGERERVDAEPLVQAAWQPFADYLKSCGVRYLYYVKFKFPKPTARLREDDNVQVIYSV